MAHIITDNKHYHDIAQAINDKMGTPNVEYTPSEMATAIANIETDKTGDATAVASDILANKTAYAKGTKLTGTIATKSDSGNVTLNDTTTSKSYAAGYYPNAHGATHTTVNIPDPTMSFDANTKKVSASGSWTKGFTTDSSYSNTYTVTLDNAKAVTGNASLNNAATSGVTYTENTANATVIPAEGALYINAGYIGNTKITLGHMIPDDTNYTNAGVGHILSGYEAYDTTGKKLIGTIATITPTFDGGGLTKGTASGGDLSGGGLTAGAGEAATVTQGEVTPSVGGTGVNSTSQSTYGLTTTKPSGTDGTNFLTFDPGASVTKNNTVHGRGSVSRAAVTRSAFSQKVTRGAVLYNGAATGYVNKADDTQALAADTTGTTVSLAADNTTIGQTSGTSNWSSDLTSNPSIAGGTNWYVPVVTASATAGTASATAGSTSVSGLTSGTYSTSNATSYYITATGGNASATGGSASVGKGITAGATANGTSTGTKTGSSSTVYLVKGTVTNNTSGGTSSGTINRGSQIKIGKGYYPDDLYYQAQSDAHSSYTPSSTYFQTSTSGAVSGAKINANQYATSDYYVKSTSASKSGGTVSWGSGWISSGSSTVTRSDLGITDKAAATYNTSTSDQTISSGNYLTGTQTIKAVTTSGIDAANIKEGVTIKVGDANNAGRIKSVTGTLKEYKTAAFATSSSKGVYAGGYINANEGGSVSGNTWTTTGTISGSNLTL